jgi:uncharacterized protein DUF5916/cellulose/xylan binding protein with CBM9 domain
MYLALRVFFVAFAVIFTAEAAEIVIPKIDQKISIDDFAGMKPRADLADKLALVENFIQSNPKDGAPSSQKTVVYLAYNDNYLYVVFLCFDNEPNKIVSALTRRENFGGDEDWIEIYIDTYNDQRRAYCFSTNAFGVQWDSRYSEALSAGGDDFAGHQVSFDALWYSDGRITDQGYIVWMEIPFKSMRFPSSSIQDWKISFGRSIPRSNEYSAWPHVSKEIQGRLTQASELTGLHNVSPGKNIQFIPYSSFRSFRFLDVDASPPEFISDKSDPAAGVDSKFVLKDSSVLDLTFNPDFSQIESDRPQVTVNQRFEVFFPEKRPFFLENAQYFETPMNLVFTRRIADPQYGGRLTGKYGPYTIGFLAANDEGPGKLALPTSSFRGDDAYFGIARFTRDIFSQSTIGALFTTRHFENSTNTVGGADFRFRLNNHWQAAGQAVGSWSDPLEGSSFNGHALNATVTRTGNHFSTQFVYEDLSPDFLTLTGFVPRTDLRSFTNQTHYYFRPAGELLLAWGPEFEFINSYDYNGTRLDETYHPSFYIELPRQTYIRLHYLFDKERIRPVDFDGLTENVDFDTPGWLADFNTSYFKTGTIQLSYGQNEGINFEPTAGALPHSADETSFRIETRLRPFSRLQMRNLYLYTELKSKEGPVIFDDHILSIRSNYQFTRQLSLRVIVQYEATIVNPELTSLEDRRNLNGDVLVTYMVNPWTALYVGYNGNRQNLSFLDDINPPSVIRTHGEFMNDANQFFMKFSYLLHF